MRAEGPSPGVVTVDLHGKNTYQAKVTVDALLRLSLIHI